MVACPFPSAATEGWVDSSTERLRRLYLISTPKDDTSAEGTQALKDLVREQAGELDALKQDIRTLRYRLSNIEAQGQNPTKQELAPPLRMPDLW
jgi:uncharacterized coiled-coil protein SlyX